MIPKELTTHNYTIRHFGEALVEKKRRLRGGWKRE